MSLRPHERAWVAFKTLLAGWAVVYAVFTPPATSASMEDYTRLLWLGATVAGAVVSVTGMALTSRPSNWARKRGTQIELVGLILLIVGPLVYLTTQVAIIFDPPPGSEPTIVNRYGLVVFIAAMVTAVLARILEVVPKYRRDLAAMVRSNG